MTHHTFSFDYTYEMVPEGKRKPRQFIGHDTVGIEVPDLTEADVPLAIVAAFSEWNVVPDPFTVEYRWYKEKLWTRFDSRNHFRPWKDDNHCSGPDLYSYSNKNTHEDMMTKIRDWANSTLYINGVMWRWNYINEPIWFVRHYGDWPHGKILVEAIQDDGYHGNIGWSHFFNANEKNLAYLYANKMATRYHEHGIPDEPIEQEGEIQVYLPEAVHFNAQRDIPHSGQRSETRMRLELEGRLQQYYQDLKDRFDAHLTTLCCFIQNEDPSVAPWNELSTWIKKQPYLSTYDDRIKWILESTHSMLWVLRKETDQYINLLNIILRTFGQCVDESLTEKY